MSAEFSVRDDLCGWLCVYTCLLHVSVHMCVHVTLPLLGYWIWQVLISEADKQLKRALLLRISVPMGSL